MALNGHEHKDICHNVDGVWYYSVNCMSNMWVGKKWERTGGYTEEMGMDTKAMDCPITSTIEDRYLLVK